MIKRVMRTNYLLPPLDMSTRQALYEAGDRSIDSDANFCSCMHTYKLVRSHSYPFFFVTGTRARIYIYIACLQETRRIARAFARLVLKIQKFACRYILT